MGTLEAETAWPGRYGAAHWYVINDVVTSDGDTPPTFKMNPMIVLTGVFAAACAAPSYNHGVVAPVHAPVHAAAHAPLTVPAPYRTSHVSGAPVTTIHQAPAVVSKQVHLGSTTYVSGHRAEIIKPPTPVLPIAVPTALKGTTQVNAPLVKTLTQTHVVNEPAPFETRVEVPYDVPVVREQIREVIAPYNVPKPYAVQVPVPYQGEPIVNYHDTAPVVERHHTNLVAQPVVGVVAHGAAYGAGPVAYQGEPIVNFQGAHPVAYQGEPIVNFQGPAYGAAYGAGPVAYGGAYETAPLGYGHAQLAHGAAYGHAQLVQEAAPVAAEY
eukprot:maker-scaffold994_size72573-snap-gene-0.16 protein:Tk02416 transcript:maker-scaffold994_size72573-snap-gene-0.16-mRNA-1 annotation:"sec7 domain containing protein"